MCVALLACQLVCTRHQLVRTSWWGGGEGERTVHVSGESWGGRVAVVAVALVVVVAVALVVVVAVALVVAV